MKEKVNLDNLKAWQQDFYQGIFNPKVENIERACIDVAGTDSLSPEARLDIYRGSILGGITTALMGIYPVCEKLVGEHYFTQMVAGYLRKYPSSSPDIGGYGEFLGDYLAGFIVNNSSAQALIYLPDTARLEWLWHKAFNAVEAELTPGTCQSITELGLVEVERQGAIQFILEPSVGMMKSAYPVDKIWQINHASHAAEELQAISLDDGAVNLLIRRGIDYEMSIESISDDLYLFLYALLNNKSFAQIAQLEFDTSIADLLGYCLQNSLIMGFRLLDE